MKIQRTPSKKIIPKILLSKSSCCDLFAVSLLLLFAVIFDALPAREILLTLLQQSVGFGYETVEERVARNANAVQEAELWK